MEENIFGKIRFVEISLRIVEREVLEGASLRQSSSVAPTPVVSHSYVSDEFSNQNWFEERAI